MPNPYFKYCMIVITTLLTFLMLVITINYGVDKFRIFHPAPDYMETVVTPNERAAKFKSFSSRCRQFEAIIFGSSRSQIYRTDFIRDLYGMTAYNFGVSAESFHGILRKLKWCIDNSFSPKLIFIPINADELYYMRDYSLPPFTLRRMDPPDIVNRKDYRSTFYLTYLLSFSATKSNLQFGIRDKQTPPRLKYNFLTGDVYYFWDKTFAINKCPAKIEKPKKNLMEAVSLLLEINNLCQKSGIRLILLWNPLPIDIQTGHKQIISFLELISPRFNFINRIPLEDDRLQDSQYYYDPGHFKESLAKDVMDSKNKVPFHSFIQELKKRRMMCKKNQEESLTTAGDFSE